MIINKDLTCGSPEIFIARRHDGIPGVQGRAGCDQSARFAAGTITARLAGRAPKAAEFVYNDKGSMATISRFRPSKMEQER